MWRRHVYISNKRELLKLSHIYPALVSFDHFSGQLTEAVLKLFRTKPSSLRHCPCVNCTTYCKSSSALVTPLMSCASRTSNNYDTGCWCSHSTAGGTSLSVVSNAQFSTRVLVKVLTRSWQRMALSPCPLLRQNTVESTSWWQSTRRGSHRER